MLKAMHDGSADTIDFKAGILYRKLKNGKILQALLEEGPKCFAVARLEGEVVETEMPNLTLKLLRNMQRPEKGEPKKKPAKAEAKPKGRQPRGKAKGDTEKKQAALKKGAEKWLLKKSDGMGGFVNVTVGDDSETCDCRACMSRSHVAT